MKATLAVGGLGGVLAAAAAAGVPALVLLGIVLLVLTGVGCWVIADPARTEHAVAIITAARTRADAPARASGPQRGRRPGTAGPRPPAAVPSRRPVGDPQLEQAEG